MDCEEFVNADEIAKGLSPFHPELVAIQAGKLMLDRINRLISKGQNFAFETTLATKSYRNVVLKAKENGYYIVLLFFWLKIPDLAVKRVATRVKEGGHTIPEEIIRRRYENGLKNFFGIFESIVDEWTFIDNTRKSYEIIAEKNSIGKLLVNSNNKWNKIVKIYKSNEHGR